MAMDIEKLVEPAADWIGGTWLRRLDAAASLLFRHGYITMSQRSAITRKLEKQVTDALASGKIVERTTLDTHHKQGETSRG